MKKANLKEMSETIEVQLIWKVICKGRLRSTIFKSADKLHLIASPKSDNSIRFIVAADLKMTARNRT